MVNTTSKDAVSVYRGRFAPSPSGNLHFGSLVTALASYLLARQANGQWLLRIDDIDTPRVKPGASESILGTLEAHGLLWDEAVYYQSEHIDRYEHCLRQLQQQNNCYFCDCTRQAIKARAPHYDGYCRHRQLSGRDCAVRLKNPAESLVLHDVLLGDIQLPKEVTNEDFVLRRRDAIWGYHLVAVLDDLNQGITQVVRGADLLLPSACQLVLYKLIRKAPPSFLHIPVAVSAPGKKLSKQNHSPELDNRRANDNLLQALAYLGLKTPSPLHGAPCSELLLWAEAHWQVDNLSKTSEKRVAEHWC